jgi:4,5-dihydroxyphthalate decarboxylase
MDNSTNNYILSDSMQTSRRGFLKTSAVAAGAAVGLSALHTNTVLAAEPTSKGKPITIAGYKLDRVEALIDGRVKVDGFDAKFEIDSIGKMNTHIFSGPQTREVTEIGLSPFMLAFANDGFRDYTLIPVFPLRLFRHKSIFVCPDNGIQSPKDLRGRKVATPGFSSTSLTWLRGIVQHEYGVKPEEIQWFVSSKDSSSKLSGGASKFENIIPKNLSVTQGPPGQDESDMLLTGQVDALFHAAEHKAYMQGDPKVVRLFPDFRTVEQAYFSKTGIFPIMHAVAIRKDFIEANPQFPKAVFNAYSQAKKLMYEHMRKLAWVTISLPWVGQEIEETRELMGDNFWPYGIEPNRKSLEALFQYSYEQGLAAKKLTIEDLFHPSTLELAES